MFETEFRKCLSSYTSLSQANHLWQEIETAYSDRGRHYHNLRHLDHLLLELLPFRNHVQHWDTLIFAIAYHDIVYSVLRKDNEEQSADLAVNRLQSLGVDQLQTERCRQHILATKKHDAGDADTNLFTDADLSILGASHHDYIQYTHQVRNEYKVYPDLMYKPGRKKVLQHFLAMPRIFKTDPFFERYETTARINLQWELHRL